MTFQFQLRHIDGNARLGRFHTAHGSVDTPVFMPVGTQATVRGLTPAHLLDANAQIILGNTYHLTLRPGDELIAELGGLHRFMAWDRPILTDSGGFQVYSLASCRKITDDAAVFRSHIDGALLELTPEKAVKIQENLGSDIAMCLDECPPFETSADYWQEAVRRTILWAKRCHEAHTREDQALFAIVQGGTNIALRQRCAEELTSLDFPGYALGGFSVGETQDQMVAALQPTTESLPSDKPRYLMGVGKPSDLLHGIKSGVDMFDCVMPTRNGRNAQAFTMDGTLRLRNSVHKRDGSPLESDCDCYTCSKFSRAYLHHLFLAKEMLGPTLLTLHNVTFYIRLMHATRDAIAGNGFAEFCQVHLARWQAKT